MPCTADNDATAAGFASCSRSAGPDRLNMVLLTRHGDRRARSSSKAASTAAASTAGEFGNTTVELHGPECPSGNRGSLNSLASSSAIGRIALARAAGRPDSRLARLAAPVSAADVDAAARQGDALARAILEEAGRALGAGIANFINIFNPDRVALMGGLTAAAGYVRSRAGRGAPPRVRADFSSPTPGSSLAVLGGRTGAFGAAALARERAS